MTQYPEAAAGWEKYRGGPVLGGPDMGTCFDVFVVDEEDEYRMYFSWRPQKSLAVATSRDGVQWSKPGIILSPKPETGWEDDLNRNAVVKHDGMYRMWYSGQARGFTRIGYASSPDGFSWTRHDDAPVLIPEYPWEGHSVMCPHVMWDEEEHVYKMWYSAGETYEPDAIGYAVSTDGVSWKKHPANPIFTPDKSLPWEQDKVTACQVKKCAGWYFMFYIGFEDVDTARICIARSRDGVTGWQRHPLNPILSPTKGSWDANACYKPYAIWNARQNKWMLWYNGRNGSPEYVGMATHDGYDLGFD
jgi:beta-1,2-mannobiose phosphorylase / 1,2-beta-oligomannan phosphorylase